MMVGRWVIEVDETSSCSCSDNSSRSCSSGCCWGRGSREVVEKVELPSFIEILSLIVTIEGRLVGSFFPVLILLNILLCVEYNQEYQQRKFKSIICVCGTALIRSWFCHSHWLVGRSRDEKERGEDGGAVFYPSGGIFRRLFSQEEEGFWSSQRGSMTMKNLERDRRRKKGAIGSQDGGFRTF